MTYLYDAFGGMIDVGGGAESDALIPTTKRVAANVNAYHTMWNEMSALDFCTKTQIATVQGLPIYKYVFALDEKTVDSDYNIVSDRSFYAKPKISIVSGMHGDERASTLFLYEFMNKVCTNPNYRKYLGAYDFHIIPITNPTGYNAGTRNNYQGININRDATTTPRTAEGQALKAYFDANEWALCLDLHQTVDADGKCAFAHMQSTASADNIEKYAKLWTKSAYPIEKLLETKYNKPHLQTHFVWEPADITTWVNYPADIADKTDVSFTIELGRTYQYYSGSTTPYNSVALEAGNTIVDKYIRTILDNL